MRQHARARRGRRRRRAGGGAGGPAPGDRALVYLYENTSGFGMNSFTAGQLVTDVSSLIIGLLILILYLSISSKKQTFHWGKRQGLSEVHTNRERYHAPDHCTWRDRVQRHDTLSQCRVTPGRLSSVLTSVLLLLTVCQSPTAARDTRRAASTSLVPIAIHG